MNSSSCSFSVLATQKKLDRNAVVDLAELSAEVRVLQQPARTLSGGKR